MLPPWSHKENIYISKIDYVILYDQNSLGYWILGQFEALLNYVNYWLF